VSRGGDWSGVILIVFRDGNMTQWRKSAVWCIGRISYRLGCESETLMTLREYYRPFEA